MAVRCREMEFSLYGEEGYEMVEGEKNFKHMGRTVDQTDDDLPVVRQNIMHTRLVWGRLGTLLQREGVEGCRKCSTRRWYKRYYFLDMRLGYFRRKRRRS